MLAPSADSEQAADAPIIAETEEIAQTQAEVTPVQDNDQFITSPEKSEVIITRPEVSEEVKAEQSQSSDSAVENGAAVQNEKSEQAQNLVVDVENKSQSPEIPQKVAFAEPDNIHEKTEVEEITPHVSEVLSPSEEMPTEKSINLVDTNVPESVKESLISVETEEKSKEGDDDNVLIRLDGNDNENETAIVKLEGTGQTLSPEGEVVHILTKLESLKTPEPDEVSGTVRASFVDFNLDEPVEIHSDEEEDGNIVDMEQVLPKVSTEESETVDMFEMGDLNLSNPELQKIREEQVRKWLKFEEENPTKERLSNGDRLPEGDEEGSGDMEDGDELTVDGLPRRVRFLTDTDGNLLISVFMSKLVQIFLFLLKVAGQALAKHVSTSSQAPAQAPRVYGTKHLHRLPRLHYSSHCDTKDCTPEMDGSHFCTIHIESELCKNDTRHQGNGRLNQLTESQSVVASATTTAENSEENSLGSSNGASNGIQGNPALVVSPPSLEPLTQGDSSPLENGKGGDEDSCSDPPSIVLLSEFPREPPNEKPPAPPIDDIDEGCNSSDETLSVSSCNSMIEILPAKDAGKEELLKLEQDISAEDGCPVILDMKSEEPRPEQEVVEPAPDINLEPASEEQSPTPNFHIDKVENTLEEAGGSDLSQPSSFIVHDIEEDLQHNFSARLPEVLKIPTIDENNNVVDYAEQVSPPPEPIQEPQRATEIEHLEPLEEVDEGAMPELHLSNCSSSSDGEDDRFISALSEQLPSVRDLSNVQTQARLSEEDGEGDQQMVSLCIQEEHISSVALTIAKWENMSKALSTENLASTPLPHSELRKCDSSPCPKMVKSLASAIEQVNPAPVVPLHPLPMSEPIILNEGLVNGSSREECNNFRERMNNALNCANYPEPEPQIISKAPGWNCWGNKIKDPKPMPTENGTCAEPDEIIYAQPNHQAGSVMTSIANPSAILKQYPKPISKGEIVMWLKEGEIHRAGLLLNYGQSHHHAPVLASPHSVPPVLVNWFFGLISRHQAEKYLHGQPSGTFLVRISTRIWGYTLSYQANNGRTKHFLISAINPAVPATLQANPEAAMPPQTGKQQRMSPFVPQGRYAFIGTNMTPYGTLVSLIRHHSHAPITKLGGEKLLNACPGGPQVAGLESLFK